MRNVCVLALNRFCLCPTYLRLCYAQACFERLDKIVPVLVLHLEPAQDADVRLAFLALLKTMLERDTTGLVCHVH